MAQMHARETTLLQGAFLQLSTMHFTGPSLPPVGLMFTAAPRSIQEMLEMRPHAMMVLYESASDQSMTCPAFGGGGGGGYVTQCFVSGVPADCDPAGAGWKGCISPRWPLSAPRAW